jgi:hypothetical protein
MTTDQPPPSKSSPKRSKWRLRVLLAVDALVLGLYVFVHLGRPAARWLGPVGEAVYDVFNPSEPPTARPSARAQRFVDEVKVLGGVPSVAVIEPGFLGIFGRSEWYSADFRTRAFDDAALGRLAASYADCIGNLALQDTSVTDAGLRHLRNMAKLRNLVIREFSQPRGHRGNPGLAPTISDAGLVHLGGLTQLWSLDLGGLPITDAGLAAIKDLPALMSLYLSRTEVKGTGLAQLKSLPRLDILYLNGCEVTEEGLKSLAGATGLQYLSLNGVPLTPEALPLLKALPRLEQLEITGCGFLDEEVAGLVKSKPKLRVVRQ